MKRSEFLRISTLGGLALLISPSLLAVKKEKIGFSVGLFYNGKELSYKNYRRIEVEQAELIRLNKNSAYIDLPKMVFPETPRDGIIKANEIRIFRIKDRELMLICKIEASVAHGTISVIWH